MLRLTAVRLPLDYDDAALRAAACKRLRVQDRAIHAIKLVRRSVDARDQAKFCFTATLDVEVDHEQALLKRLHDPQVQPASDPVLPELPLPHFAASPVVVGAGPAGLFAALQLSLAGAKPILIERGAPVEERALQVERMRTAGLLDPESNVQFGEGGAGAFSDGKLTTGIKSPWVRAVLQSFVDFGAPEEILVLQKPHVGTDLLRGVVASMRKEILRLGGTVLFHTRMEGLVTHNNRVVGVRVTHAGVEREIPASAVLLCVGHSARDTMENLYHQGVTMLPKPFAVGVRVEHPREMIDRSQYGAFAGHPRLGAASYKLNVRTEDGRGVYTFCMCPGGEVIAAASEPNRLAVNGMSYHARDGRNSNAALLVGVRPEDFPTDHPLAGFAFQRAIEEKAFALGGGGYHAPVETVGDFLADRPSGHLGSVIPSYTPGVTATDLRLCLPDFVTQNLKAGLLGMDRQLKGFAMADAVLTGVETRSSSPVRIPRDESMLGGIEGFYPVGEGAGFAGGIVSAAVDGIRAARAAMERSNR